jgi:hypothetical protein
VAALAPLVVHVAGAADGLVQRCVACGAELYDNRAWFEGQAAVLTGTGETEDGPSWWPVGALVATDKDGSGQPSCRPSITYVIEGRPLEDDEHPCT